MLVLVCRWHRRPMMPPSGSWVVECWCLCVGGTGDPWCHHVCRWHRRPMMPPSGSSVVECWCLCVGGTGDPRSCWIGSRCSVFWGGSSTDSWEDGFDRSRRWGNWCRGAQLTGSFSRELQGTTTWLIHVMNYTEKPIAGFLVYWIELTTVYFFKFLMQYLYLCK